MTIPDSDPLTLNSSPLAFVITGPSGRHRGVLARSSLPYLDLIGMESNTRNNKGNSENFIRSPSSSYLSIVTTPTQINSVRGGKVSVESIRDSSVSDRYLPDTRQTYLSFAWRGLASSSDIRDIRDSFASITADLNKSILDRQPLDFEFEIAPLILHCQECHEKMLGRLIARKYIMIFSLIIYVICILFVFLYRLMLKAP